MDGQTFRARSRVLVPGQGNAGGRPEVRIGSPSLIFLEMESLGHL